MFEKSSLKNGIRVVVSPMPQVKSVTVLILVRAGSRYETAKNNGVSHFLEHMMFKGTKRRPTPMEISNIIDSVGGEYNAFTSKEYTGFYIKAPTEHLALVLDLLSDLLGESLFAEKEIARERGVIVEEINMYEDEPQAKVGDVYSRLIYGQHPLGRTVIGSKELISKMGRDELVAYFGQNYNTHSMVISVAGGVETAEVVSLLEKYFATVASGSMTKFEKFSDQQKKAESSLFFKKTDQAHLMVGVRAYARGHVDRYVVTLLSRILGGMSSSRLWHEVREKRGLAYYVGSEVEQYADTGGLAAVAGVNLKSVSEVIKVILEQLEVIKSHPVKPEELALAKEMSKGKMVLALEDSYNVASWYGMRELLEEKIMTPEDVLREIEKVTTQDIQRVAGDIFKTEKLNLAVVGPFKEKDKFGTLLKI